MKQPIQPLYGYLRGQEVVPIEGTGREAILKSNWENQDRKKMQVGHYVHRGWFRKVIFVSTVFLGYNKCFMDDPYGEQPPLWFETMIGGGVFNGHVARYSTWQEAEVGHRAALNLALGWRHWPLRVYMGTAEFLISALFWVANPFIMTFWMLTQTIRCAIHGHDFHPFAGAYFNKQCARCTALRREEV